MFGLHLFVNYLTFASFVGKYTNIECNVIDTAHRTRHIRRIKIKTCMLYDAINRISFLILCRWNGIRHNNEW